jgi:hypothetical protein
MAVFGPYLGIGWTDLAIFSLVQLGSVGFTKRIREDGTGGGVLTRGTVHMRGKSPGPWRTDCMRSDTSRAASISGPSLGDGQLDPPFLQLANLWSHR